MTWHFKKYPSCFEAHISNQQSSLHTSGVGHQESALPGSERPETGSLDVGGDAYTCDDEDDDDEFGCWNDPSPGDVESNGKEDVFAESHLGINQSLLVKFRDHCNSGIAQMPLSQEMKTKVELLQMLKEARAPFYLYSKIWKWAQSACDRQVQFHGAGTRDSAVKELMSRYNLEDTLPVTTSITLPQCGETVNITTHNFLPQLYSMLTDPHLMRDENLLFCQDDPFSAPVSKRGPNYVMQDIIDGSVYREAHKVHVKIAGRDLLVPIILYIDKTHVDVQGRLCLEPVTFTLGIFKKEVRNYPMAWRPLGFIVNQSNLCAVDGVGRAKDYHFVLSFILDSLQKAQQMDGIAWSFQYKQKAYNVVMKIPLLFVIGDNEGHDKLCGKYLNRVASKHLCRYCDVPKEKTGRAHAHFKYIKASQIAHLAANNEVKELQRMSYHCLHNAFTDLIFCDSKLGINGATLAELLHLVQHGLFLYFGAALFGEKAVKKSTSKGKKRKACGLNLDLFEEGGNDSDDGVDDSDSRIEEDVEADENVLEDECLELDDDDSDSVASYQSDVMFGEQGVFAEFGTAASNYTKCVSNGVFVGDVKVEFNNLAKSYGRLLCHQSDREYDRSYFVSGLISGTKKNGKVAVSKKNGHEERCVLLLCHIILCSHKGPYFDEKMGANRCGLYILVMSLLLLLENFLRSPKIEKKDITQLHSFIPIFLSLYKAAVAREVGMGMNFLKYHLLRHLPNDLLRFGPSSSADSSAGESMHKDFKDDARRTQKNSQLLDMQTAKNHSHTNAISRAVREMNPPASMIGACDNSGDLSESNSSSIAKGTHYYVDDEGMFVVHKKASKKPANWFDKTLQADVTEFLQKKVLPGMDGDRIVLKTQAKVGGILYRADPGAVPPRHDWVNVQWSGGHGEIPGRIMVFVDLPANTIISGISLNDHDVLEVDDEGVFAIITTLERSLYSPPNPKNLPNKNDQLAHEASKLMYWAEIVYTHREVRRGTVREQVSVPIIYLVNVSATFLSPVIAVPFNLDGDHSDDSMWWLFIEPRHKWNEILRDVMSEMIANAEKHHNDG